jgi:hypothetical protein
MRVKRVCIPNRLSRSSQHKREQKKRWFRDGQRRTACEGRISVIKRRNGLNRCRYKADAGSQGLDEAEARNLIDEAQALFAEATYAATFASTSSRGRAARMKTVSAA